MKRSQINTIINEAILLFEVTGCKLPPFAYFSPEDWLKIGEEANEIRENYLGWDVTDYGKGDYSTMGLLLFTLRNGNYHKPDQYPKRYAEKLMIIQEGQLSPMHFHWNKREDIINRGGGNLQLRLFAADDQEKLSGGKFSLSLDGIRKTCGPGEIVTLQPGQSICLEPYIYHEFYAQKNSGDVVIGEVSDVNDDDNDNRFLESLDRFPKIEEDELPIHLLCNEYPGQ
ncbi:MAG: D-lyxose/D-mannose family sugar isomerase [Desulfocapsaceae bacterium]|nr:D-lyxose/D-mannose family sugar isomerase [Desulfocapsaceae bacterium]